MKNNLIILFAFLMSFTSCKKNCSCTDIACLCPESPSILVAISEQYHTNGGYTQEEINNFYVIRTDPNFQKIDSIKIAFEPSTESSGYSHTYAITQSTFANSEDLRNYNFLIKSSFDICADTVLSISYDVTMEKEVCNKCTPCEDKYIQCMKYSNQSLVFDRILQNNLTIKIHKYKPSHSYQMLDRCH